MCNFIKKKILVVFFAVFISITLTTAAQAWSLKSLKEYFFGKKEEIKRPVNNTKRQENKADLPKPKTATSSTPKNKKNEQLWLTEEEKKKLLEKLVGDWIKAGTYVDNKLIGSDRVTLTLTKDTYFMTKKECDSSGHISIEDDTITFRQMGGSCQKRTPYTVAEYKFEIDKKGKELQLTSSLYGRVFKDVFKKYKW